MKNLNFLRMVLACNIFFMLFSLNLFSQTKFTEIVSRQPNRNKVHIENGSVETTKIHDGAHSAMWELKREGSNYVFKNRWKGTYLSASSSELTMSNDPKSASSQWKLLSTDGNGSYRIKNVHSGLYLHQEKGYPSVGQVSDGWWSAQWFVKIPLVVVGSSSHTSPKKDKPKIEKHAPIPGSSTLETVELTFNVHGIRCIKVSEIDGKNELFGKISAQFFGDYSEPKVVWSKTESNAVSVEEGGYINIQGGDVFPFIRTTMSLDKRFIINANIMDSDEIGSNDQLGKETKNIFLKDLKAGKNMFTIDLENDGDHVIIDIQINKSSLGAKPTSEASSKGKLPPVSKTSQNTGPITQGKHAPVGSGKKHPPVKVNKPPVIIPSDASPMYFRYTDQAYGGVSLDLKVGDKIYVVPGQTAEDKEGISFDPDNPKICGKTFTVKSVTPQLTFQEPFPERMRDTQNGYFMFMVTKL